MFYEFFVTFFYISGTLVILSNCYLILLKSYFKLDTLLRWNAEYIRMKMLVHLFASSHGYKTTKVHDIFLLYTDITYQMNDTEIANLSSLSRISCILWLKKNHAGKVAQKMTSSHVTVTRHRHSVGEVQKHGTWVSHALTDGIKLQCSSAYWYKSR